MSTSTAHLTNFTSNSFPNSLNSDALQPTKLPMAVLGKTSNILTPKLGFESIRLQNSHTKVCKYMDVFQLGSSCCKHPFILHTQPYLKTELQEYRKEILTLNLIPLHYKNHVRNFLFPMCHGFVILFSQSNKNNTKDSLQT